MLSAENCGRKYRNGAQVLPVYYQVHTPTCIMSSTDGRNTGSTGSIRNTETQNTGSIGSIETRYSSITVLQYCFKYFKYRRHPRYKNPGAPPILAAQYEQY